MFKNLFSSTTLFKIGHSAGFILFVIIILFGITGYGMTLGIISPQFSRAMHFTWLPIIGLVALVVHTFWAIRMSLIRKNIWNKYSRAVLIGFYILLLYFFSSINFF